MEKLLDREGMEVAYLDVRNDATETSWAVFKYNDNNFIETDSTGTEWDDMLSKFSDDERVYAYARLHTGDEMSKRAKFAFITWIGPSVSPLKKAKVSTDKSFVKQVITQYAAEILADDKGDVKEEVVQAKLAKAGGAAYGVGGR